MERKRKGGAERERIKRRKVLATDAASCCKIPAMFAGKGTGRSELHLHNIYQGWGKNRSVRFSTLGSARARTAVQLKYGLI